MATHYLIAWYVLALFASVATWFVARRIRSIAGRGLLRTGIPAVAFAIVPASAGGWLPAALYFVVGRDLMESIGISMISIGVLWGGLFAAYWLGLVYRDALFGGGERKN